jgi:DNA-binding transcriptional LysR family regulator
VGRCAEGGRRPTDRKRNLHAPDHIVAIRLLAEPDPSLTATPIPPAIRLVIAAAPSIAAQARPSEAVWWSKQSLLTPSVGEQMWERVWHALNVRPVPGVRRRLFSSYAAALEAACAGHGIVLAPLPFAEPELKAGRLSRISNMRLPIRAHYSLVARAELPSTRRARLLKQRIVNEVRA